MKSNCYHPMWYQRNRPYAKFAKQTVSKSGFTMNSLREIQERIIREWNSALELNKIDKNQISTDLMPEISLALYYGGFAASGYNLFSFAEPLGEMLANTNASEVPIGMLKSPYPVYFIQFHRPFLWGKLEIAGCYIIDEPNVPALQILLVLKPINETAHWMASPSGYFYLPLPREPEAPLGVLIQKTIDSEISNKWEHATQSMPIDDASVIDVREQRAKRETMDLSSARFAIQESMEYVANCLCYLSSHNEFKSDYPIDSPDSLVNIYQNGKTEKQKQKAQSQLKSMGFLPITYVNLSAEISESSSQILDGAKSGKSIHWRRGHWRNQKKGKDLTITELVWIKPTLVGGGEVIDSVREYKVN